MPCCTIILDQQYLQELDCNIAPQNNIPDQHDLVSSVEVFGAVLGLLELWVKIQDRPPSIANLVERLDCVSLALQNTMNNVSPTPPDEYFRLYLLQDSLQRTLQLLRELS